MMLQCILILRSRSVCNEVAIFKKDISGRQTLFQITAPLVKFKVTINCQGLVFLGCTDKKPSYQCLRATPK